MSLSGWCGTRGRPDCARCRHANTCDCACHDLETAQHKGNQRSVETVEWENEDEPDRSVDALQPGSDHLPALPERGCW